MPNIQLSKNLYILRKSHDLTQEDLGKLLHISRQAYSNYENRKRNPDLESLMLLSSLYHLSLDELVNRNLSNNVESLNRERNIALDLTTENTLYLTPEETYLIMKYRDLSKEKRSSLKNFADSL